MRLLSVLWVPLLLSACHQFSHPNKSPANETSSQTLDVSMERLTNSSSESAWVKSVEVVCSDETFTRDFTESNQSTVLYRNLNGCDVNLTSFVIDDGTSITFNRTNRTSQGFVVFDAEGGQGAVDARLAKGTVTIADHCNTNCDYTHVSANFEYSELLSEEVELQNNLSVSTFSVGIEKEPAPSCHLNPHFEQSGQQEPELVIDFSNCVDLFPSGMMELSVMAHDPSATYGIENLHDAINAALQTKDGASGFEIRLTVADLKTLAGTDDIFEALSLDLVIPTRNVGGMSIKYYVIDNNCDVTETPTVQLENCETAYGFGATTLESLGITNKWGWEMTVQSGEQLSTPLYAGAGGNDISHGVQVGVLNYSYVGTTLTVSYDMFAGAVLNGTHLYLGTSHPASAAPGQFTYQHSLSEATTDSYVATVPADATLYVVAHAEVCPAQN